MSLLGIGLSTSILVLFLIIIAVGYVYVNETKFNTEQINGTLTQFIKRWNVRQEVDNARFNQTLHGLEVTYDLIVGNQKRIINLTNSQVNATNQTNTLVKFLSDNFGQNSDYLDRENYQYQQANKTYEFVKMALYNQEQRMIKHQLAGLDNQNEIIRLLKNGSGNR